MEWKKVKWLIIALLLAVNIFLGISIAYKYSRAIRAEIESMQAAVAIVPPSFGFSESKFSHLPRYLYSYTGERNRDIEQDTAQSMMHGKAALTDAGGGVLIYNSPSVERVVFRRGGSIAGIIKTDADVSIQSCITAAAESSDLETKEIEGTTVFCFDGIIISNAFLTYEVYGEYTSLTATLPLSSDWLRDQKSRSRGEMIIALRNIVEQNGLGELISVEAIYYTEAAGGMVLKLIPAWRAECTNGSITVSLIDKTVLESSIN